jgi:capsular polysaccharide transport system permease protein
MLESSRSTVRELKLEPLHSRGELVLDDWWKTPTQRRSSILQRHLLFILTFIIPVAAAIVYFGVIASGQYLAEAQFLVRTSAQDDTGNLGAFLQNQKMSRASDETYALAEYLRSRDVVRTLIDGSGLKEVLASPAADIFNRYPSFHSRKSDEALYRHFLKFTSVDVSSESGIATLRVWAFTPRDAHNIADAMMKSAERLVNELNARYYEDSLRLANKFVDEAKIKVSGVENELAAYRNTERVVDPGKESAAALLGIGQMMTTLMTTEAELSQQIAMAPTSPQIAPLRDKVASLREQVAKERSKIAGDTASMASKLTEFDRLMLERELAARGLEAAVTHLISARENAERQQFYLETVVQPGFADQPLYPKRALSVIVVAGFSLCLYWIMKTIFRNILEHQP